MIKLVTILFADVVGSTAQAESLAPDEARALMAEFFEAMSEEIRAEGGTIERIIGDAIMVDFGVPVAREDDPIRAVRAARRMLARLDHFNEDRPEPLRVRVRIGINTGDVSTGGSYGEQLMVMGDAVNVAARLQQAAEPNTILIGERTARAVRDRFELHEVEQLEMKGKKGKVAAFLVEGEGHPEERIVTPFVGRASELEALRDVLERARLKKAGVVATIVGEPGAGKSRLIAELVAALGPDAKVVEGACSPFGQNAALRPFQDVLRAEAGIVGTDPPEVELDKIRHLLARLPLDPSLDPERATAALGATFGVRTALERFAGLDPREAQREVLAAWQALLTALAADMPVIVVVEDLQWADEGTLGLMGELAGGARAALAFLCSARPELLEERAEWLAGLDDHTSTRLQPLDKDESAALVATLLDSPDLPGPLLDEMLGKAEGNPFFLEEIVRRLIDLGQLEQRDGRWTLATESAAIEIPDNVRLAILSRIDLLPPEHRQVLQQASVVGRVFWTGAVRELTGLPDVDALLDGLRQGRFITERFPSAVPGETEFSFLHTLIRDVAYEGLPQRMRGRAHAGAGAWVEKVRGEAAEESAELLAYHYEQAFEVLSEDAFRRAARRYSTIAAHGAVRRFAIHQAEGFGRTAVALSTRGQERIEALEALGDLYMLTFKSDGAWNSYTSALSELEGESIQDSRLYANLAAKAALVPARWRGTMARIPPHDEIGALIERGLEATEERDSRPRAMLLASRAFLLGLMREEGHEEPVEDGLALAEEAAGMAERLGDANLVSAALDGAITYLMPQGMYGPVYEFDRRRVALAPEMKDTREISDAFATAAGSAFSIGFYVDSFAHATDAVKRARGIDAGGYLHGLVWRVCAGFMAGHWRDALADQSEIERLQDDAGGLPSNLAMWAYGYAFLCSERLGDAERANRYMALIQEVIDEREKAGRDFHSWLGAPARAMAARGDFATPHEWLKIERSFYSGSHLEALCEVVGAEGSWDDAPGVIALARAEVSECGLEALRYFADRLEGRLSLARDDPHRAERLLRRSSEGFATLGAPWEEARSSLLLADAFAQAGRAQEATSAASVALATFKRLGSTHEAETATRLVAGGRV